MARAVQKLSVRCPPPDLRRVRKRWDPSNSALSGQLQGNKVVGCCGRDKLFCAFTCHIVNKKTSSIEKHHAGQKVPQGHGGGLPAWGDAKCTSPEPVLPLLKAAEAAQSCTCAVSMESMEEPELESSEVWPFCTEYCSLAPRQASYRSAVPSARTAAEA